MKPTIKNIEAIKDGCDDWCIIIRWSNDRMHMVKIKQPATRGQVLFSLQSLAHVIGADDNLYDDGKGGNNDTGTP